MTTADDRYGLRYTRRRDRWLARVWPPKRQEMRRMEVLLNYQALIAQDELFRAVLDSLTFGGRTERDDEA